MSAEQARAVFVTREQRDDWETLAGLMDEEAFNPAMVAGLKTAVASWDAAPADAGDAIAQAMRDYWGYENYCSDEQHIPMYLRALGIPL